MKYLKEVNKPPQSQTKDNNAILYHG